ncbi:MAG: hypothetical protein K8R40_10350 [Anaerolineaceae bacterium]|nr:hypothetical protein [Anaerolineaceae bacterium]
MKKEKDYTLTIDVHISKEEKPNAMRRYSLEIYGHPITEIKGPITFELSNMRDEQALKVGKKVLNAIWAMAEHKDGSYWSE